MLKLKNITKSYSAGDFNQKALNNVNLNFRSNEFVAILGESGSGKTTLLNIIGGLDRYDKGDLTIEGKSTKNFSKNDWDSYRNNSIGFIFQNYNLISHLNIMDNVEMGMTLSGISTEEKKKIAIKTLKRVGLEEHMYKKPNQLSGGQMQRVAIARALATNPNIILADEPTGSLDSETSKKIMDLIKEISKEKLVIMVTHNSEIAKNYAGRVVKLKDGKVISDNLDEDKEYNKKDYKFRNTKMNFLTALKLSGKNIMTKKWRTALTSIASSIGIIGIALILSLSNGFDQKIAEVENETLSGFPIMIMQNAVEMNTETYRSINSNEKSFNDYPDSNLIYPYDPNENSLTHINEFNNEYIKYINNIDPNLISGISYSKDVNMNIIKKENSNTSVVNKEGINFTAYPSTFDHDNNDYLEKNYDLLSGNYPKSKNDLVLIVDKKNRVDKKILNSMNIDINNDGIDFSEIIGYEMKLAFNDDYYKQYGEYFNIINQEELNQLYNSDKTLKLKIVGIIRTNEKASLAAIEQGIAYSEKLSEYFISNAKDSEIVVAQKKAEYNVLTGETFLNEENNSFNSENMQSMMTGKIGNSITKEKALQKLGANNNPSMITIYASSFETKEMITDYLNEWNNDKSEDEMIVYTDMAETVTSLMGSTLDSITLVLIAFAAISLVVSLIMVAIITYISVLERTKEIGILRSLGAREKDISRVFNAETFIIGSLSGLIGISVAYLLTIPTNMILYRLTDMKNIAQLNPIHAIILIIISVLLTMIGGIIPAKIASKKDPVEALRSE